MTEALLIAIGIAMVLLVLSAWWDNIGLRQHAKELEYSRNMWWRLASERLEDNRRRLDKLLKCGRARRRITKAALRYRKQRKE